MTIKRVQLPGHVKPISDPTQKHDDEREEGPPHDPNASSSNDNSIPLPTTTPTSFVPADHAQPAQQQSSQGTPDAVCFGTSSFLRALWADISEEIVPIHIRTDAKNLVTTAQTTHLPEQKETHHLIHMLRHESNTGHLDDLSHIASEYCLADPLTKHSKT